MIETKANIIVNQPM